MKKNDPGKDGGVDSGREEASFTRREIVKRSWAAPVFVAVNLPKGVFAQGAISPVETPPTVAPPTVAPPPPTVAPPTFAPPPPTVAPPTVAPPTFFPPAFAPPPWFSRG